MTAETAELLRAPARRDPPRLGPLGGAALLVGGRLLMDRVEPHLPPHALDRLPDTALLIGAAAPLKAGQIREQHE
jgi:hypothetical protein